MSSTLFAILLISSAAQATETVRVAELSIDVTGDERAQVDAAALTARIRDVVERAVPGAQVVDSGASLIVGGHVFRSADSWLASLELRGTHPERLIATESALGGTPEELADAIAAAAADLFRARAAQPSEVVRPQPPPQLPQQAPDLQADPDVLVAWDRARLADASGADDPDAAAAAWSQAAAAGGNNPVRDLATLRATQWERYAETKVAFDAQLAKDTSRLRKLLPLTTITSAAKLELMARHAQTYGSAHAGELLSLVPSDLRHAVTVALACEDGDAQSCAATADRVEDASTQARYLERACTLGARGACATAGDRFLQPATRDVARAVTVLQRGCSSNDGRSCARLARMQEEGDGIAVNVVAARELREKACDAGDGESCRRLALLAEPGRAEALWRKGCERGDSTSCTLLRVSVNGAATEAKQAVPVAAQPAFTPGPSGRHVTGVALVALGAIAASGAAFAGFDSSMPDRSDGRRYLRTADPRNTPSATLAVALAAAAALSAGAGVFLLSTDPEPAKPDQGPVGMEPTVLGISGKLP